MTNKRPTIELNKNYDSSVIVRTVYSDLLIMPIQKILVYFPVATMATIENERPKSES